MVQLKFNFNSTKVISAIPVCQFNQWRFKAPLDIIMVMACSAHSHSCVSLSYFCWLTMWQSFVMDAMFITL